MEALSSNFGETNQPFWSVSGCSHLSFLQRVLHDYFSSETVPLHVVVMMMILFIVSCFTTLADDVKEVSVWRTAVLQ